MTSLALLVAIGLPAVIIIVLRSEAAVAFFALCAGSVLLQFVGGNAVLAADTMIPGGNPEFVVRIILLLLPLLLSIVLLRKSVPSSKLFFNLMPAIGTGLSGVLIAAPVLPFGARQALAESPFWDALITSQDLIIGGTALVALLSLWLMHRGKHEKGHKKGH